MAKLKSKKVINYKGNVYDLTVENTSSYNIEGISVHNSAAGCLLSWCLGITKIDPIRFKLYFERFMNPERNATPDIDVDFESGSDIKTTEFLITKYGKERVFPVITFFTFGEKGCIKDVTRAMGKDTGYSSEVFLTTKAMPEKWEESLQEWIDNYTKSTTSDQTVVSWLTNPDIKPVIDNTIKLQGQIRSLGKHAAGVIITPSPIWYNIPVNMVSGEIVSGFQESGSGKDLSELGILKLDRLNLTTLNIIKQTIQYVKERTGKDITQEVDFLNIEDPGLFEELKTSSNSGVFQFESDGITQLAKSIDVDCFDEVVATTSLYRPGPMGVQAHTDYIKNKKNPTEIKYVNEKLAPLLKNTKGVLIYQEQLMFIANVIGGMTLGEGDNLRKVMDKASKIISKSHTGELTDKEKEDKNYKEYLKLWDKFKLGAQTKGFSETEVKDIESWLVEYLGYSFNLSHAVSYSYLTMQTLFLKRHYPVEFYCALLNNQKGSSDKEKHKKWLYSAIQGARTKGIEVKKPSLNSGWEYKITGDNEIIMGFSSINGVGEKAYNEVMEKNLSTMSKEDFFSTKWTKFNKTAFEACVKAGVFDSWSESRDEINFWREISKATSKKKKAELEAENRVFEKTTDEQKDIEFFEVSMIDFTIMIKIAFIQEEFMRLYNKPISSVVDFESSDDWYYFYLDKITIQKTKRGKPYWSLLVSDGATTKRINMWEGHYITNKHVLKEGRFFVSKFIKQNDFLGFDETCPVREASV